MKEKSNFVVNGIRFQNSGQMIDFMREYHCDIACGDNFSASIISDNDNNLFLTLSGDNDCGVILSLGKKLTDGKKDEILNCMHFFSNPDLRVYQRLKK